MTIPVKLTRAHQVTLPKRLLARAGWLEQEYFVAELRDDALILKPMTAASATAPTSLADLRRHFARLGVTRHDAEAAVAWARRSDTTTGRPRRRAR